MYIRNPSSKPCFCLSLSWII